MRRFELADLDEVLAIEQDSFGPDAWDKKLFREYHRIHPDLFLAAKIGRRIAGYIITCAGARSAELASIAVRPRDRRRGVAQAMLHWTLAELRSKGVKTWWLMVEVDNQPAIRFYEQNGFVRTKRVKRYYGAGRDAWRMRRALSGPQEQP